MAGDVTMDGRKAEDVLTWIQQIAPYYVPGLDVSGDNAGSALLKIFSHMAEDIIKRLDQVPEKNFMAFLDTLGFSLNPPQPARVPIEFIVAEGAVSDVYVPAGTQAMASANKEHPELTYEVEPGCGFTATVSSLKKVYSVDPERDVVIEHLAAIGNSSYPEIFTGSPNLQEHILYIGHNDLFNVRGIVDIEIIIESSGFDPADLVWEYYGEAIENGKSDEKDDWRSLKTEKTQSPNYGMAVINVRGIGPVFNQKLNSSGIYRVEQLLALTPGHLSSILHSGVQIAADIQESAGKCLWDKVRASLVTPDTGPLSKPEHFTLHKDIKGEIKEFELPFNKIKSRWIRCRYNGPKIEDTFKPVKVAVKLDNRDAKGVKPDMALYNDIALDLDKDTFLPFGERPNMYDSFYIACNDVFSKKGSTVELYFTNMSSISTNPVLSWEYWNGKGWDILPYCKDYTESLKKKDSHTVSFECPGDLEKVKVGGHENRWIRARLVGGDYGKPEFQKKDEQSWIIDYSKITAPELSGIEISYSYPNLDHLPAQHLITYNNLDYGGDFADLDFKPFNWLPETGQCLYLGFNRALSGGPFNILFSMEEREYPESFMPRVRWEYRSAGGWKRVQASDGTKNLTRRGILSMTFPDDMEAVKVFGDELFWVRGLLISDQSNQFVPRLMLNSSLMKKIVSSNKVWQKREKTLNVDSNTNETGSYSPTSKGINLNTTRVSYTKTIKGELLGSSDGTPGQSYVFSRYPALEAEVWVNEISSITEAERKLLAAELPSGVCQDTDADGKLTGFWVKWSTTDDFLNSTSTSRHYLLEQSTGKVIFGDGIHGKIPPAGKDNLKASYITVLQTCEKPLNIDCNANGTGNYSPMLKGIHLNTTWASHTETVKDELLGSSDGTAGQSYVFSRRPALEAEVWVNEISSITTAERKSLAAELPSCVYQDTDADGNLTGFWVKWNIIDDFLNSTSASRHYLLEPSTGKVIFGDGIHGKIPPTGKDNLKASYRTGGGKIGNIKAREITSLKSSLAFIEGVYNPEVADGGMNLETEDQLKDRAPQHLKNRGRAITKEDFERIALEISRKVARAKCIPNLNNACKRELGWVTLVIVPESGDEKPMPSEELKEQVLTRLRERSSLMLMPRRITVRGPTYLEVSVSAVLISRSLAMVPAIENEAYNRLKKHLHPLKGGADGSGWEFGRLPCLSDFYCIFEEIDGVDHVKELSMEVKGMTKGQKLIITPNSDQEYQVEPYCLIFGSDHDISVTFEVPGDDS